MQNYNLSSKVVRRMHTKIKPEIDVVNQFNQNTLVAHLGIEITEIGDDFIKAKMPVDSRTKQPMGLLHGGASVVLSESLGSMASWLIEADPSKKVVGVEVNANHLKSAQDGFVYAVTKPVKLGKTLHVWNTEVYDEQDQILCISRLTVMVQG